MKPTNNRHRIAVIGCGSLGSLFAARFAMAGNEIWGVTRSEAHREAIAEHGLVLQDGDQQTKVRIHACSELPSTIQSRAAHFDLVLIAVKSYDTEQVAAELVNILTPGTPVLTLQNGLGNAEALADQLPSHPLMVGSTTFGALQESAGVVRLTGRGECVIGNWEQSDSATISNEASSRIQSIALLFEGAAIPCRIAADVRSVLWKKLAINAVINPLTALLGVCNGELIESSDGDLSFRKGVDKIANKVLSEILVVATSQHIVLPELEELHQDIRKVCRATAENQSSMFRDAQNGKQTEIDAINGAVVRIGIANGIEAVTNRRLAYMVNAHEQYATIDSLLAATQLP